MKFSNPLKGITKFEIALWSVSVVTVSAAFLLAPQRDWLTLVASLIGVTALIFMARGHILAQILFIVFALFYGTVSFFFRYYGELITYVCMSLPSAIVALISWARHPFKKTAQVEIAKVSGKKLALVGVAAVVGTVAFYFILRALGTANLLFSTLSIATSLTASLLTILRSPLYAVAYAANDIILIVLWSLATAADIAYLPMIVCFVMFLANDIYGFVSWSRRRTKQQSESAATDENTDETAQDIKSE